MKLPPKAKSEFAAELTWIGIAILILGPIWFVVHGEYDVAGFCALLGLGALVLRKKLQKPPTPEPPTSGVDDKTD